MLLNSIDLTDKVKRVTSARLSNNNEFIVEREHEGEKVSYTFRCTTSSEASKWVDKINYWSSGERYEFDYLESGERYGFLDSK